VESHHFFRVHDFNFLRERLLKGADPIPVVVAREEPLRVKMMIKRRAVLKGKPREGRDASKDTGSP